jgi:hypothetical protein
MNTPQRPPHSRPSDVMRELVTLLRTQGLTRIYWAACAVAGVLSVAQGLTVWTDGRRLRWRVDGQDTLWPADDTEGAATQLAKLAVQRRG